MYPWLYQDYSGYLCIIFALFPFVRRLFLKIGAPKPHAYRSLMDQLVNVFDINGGLGTLEGVDCVGSS